MSRKWRFKQNMDNERHVHLNVNWRMIHFCPLFRYRLQ